jgi:hypothetical protein
VLECALNDAVSEWLIAKWCDISDASSNVSVAPVGQSTNTVVRPTRAIGAVHHDDWSPRAQRQASGENAKRGHLCHHRQGNK